MTKITIKSDFDSHLNEPQRNSIEAMIPLLWGAHFIDIIIRINGEDRRVQGDWIKHLFENPFNHK